MVSTGYYHQQVVLRLLRMSGFCCAIATDLSICCREEKVLDLSENKLDTVSAQSLCTFLKSPTCCLREIILAKADMDDAETAIVMEVPTTEKHDFGNKNKILKSACFRVCIKKQTNKKWRGRKKSPHCKK